MFRWFKSLFTPTTSKEPKVQFEEEHQGYLISVAPQRTNGQYRIAATICRTDNPERKYEMVRADVFPDLETANDQTLRKAKLVIEQLGNGMFKD